jgi:hypothetical protein
MRRKGGLKDFSDADCAKPVTPGTGKFGHVPFIGFTPLSEKSVSAMTVLKATTGGVAVIPTSTSLEASGGVENTESGGETVGTGTETVTYNGVTANHGCSVTGSAAGVVKTAELNLKPVASGLKFEPVSGSTFATFTLSGCMISALNHSWTVSGSVIGTSEGGEVSFTHIGTTGQSTLSVEGSIPAGIEGIGTLTAPNHNALSIT